MTELNKNKKKTYYWLLLSALATISTNFFPHHIECNSSATAEIDDDKKKYVLKTIDLLCCGNRPHSAPHRANRPFMCGANNAHWPTASIVGKIALVISRMNSLIIVPSYVIMVHVPHRNCARWIWKLRSIERVNGAIEISPHLHSQSSSVPNFCGNHRFCCCCVRMEMPCAKQQVVCRSVKQCFGLKIIKKKKLLSCGLCRWESGTRNKCR